MLAWLNGRFTSWVQAARPDVCVQRSGMGIDSWMCAYILTPPLSSSQGTLTTSTCQSGPLKSWQT